MSDEKEQVYAYFKQEEGGAMALNQLTEPELRSFNV